MATAAGGALGDCAAARSWGRRLRRDNGTAGIE